MLALGRHIILVITNVTYCGKIKSPKQNYLADVSTHLTSLCWYASKAFFSCSMLILSLSIWSLYIWQSAAWPASELACVNFRDSSSLLCFSWVTTKKVKKVKGLYSSSYKPIWERRSVTCHEISHRVTCQQVNTVCLNPNQAGQYLIYLPKWDGRLSWSGWLKCSSVDYTMTWQKKQIPKKSRYRSKFSSNS